MPGTSDVGENLKELNASKTKRPRRQKVAIALNQARRAGNKKVGRGQDKPVPGKPGMVMETAAEAKKEHEVGRGQAIGGTPIGGYPTPKLDAIRSRLQATGPTPRLDKLRTKLQGMNPAQREAGKAKLKARGTLTQVPGSNFRLAGGDIGPRALGGGQDKKKVGKGQDGVGREPTGPRPASPITPTPGRPTAVGVRAATPATPSVPSRLVGGGQGRKR